MKKDHTYYMNMALLLAKKASKTNTLPNPLVGCVIVKNDQVIGSGYHEKCGQSHAEINAINSVINKKDLEGSTFYITLEPCAHLGKQPPCVNEIIKYKVSHVVIPFLDPNVKTKGFSIKQLQQAGIQVTLGILQDECFFINKDFLFYQASGKVFTLAKWASSLDGKIATFNKHSKWLSSKQAREHVHQTRNNYQGILIGSGTLNIDNPSLNVRFGIENPNQPVRIIVSSFGNINFNNNIFTDNLAANIVITDSKINMKNTKGAKIISIENLLYDNRLQYNKILDELKKINIMSLIIEGGQKILSDALEQEVVEELNIYYAPKILGGHMGVTNFENNKFANIDTCSNYSIAENKMLGDTIFIRAYSNSFLKIKDTILKRDINNV
ncbi:bifunctional diaminohydroxyphosphoribosylaminopyrimidine deaminase/5-amino-6-(5-phosphoribosylamino)uracil reductase RibD [Rickettsiales bacterium LUAb2]